MHVLISRSIRGSSFGGKAVYLGSGIESGVGLRFEPFSWARHLLWVPAVFPWCILRQEDVGREEESSWFVYPGHDLMSKGSGISIPRESSPVLLQTHHS